MRGGYWRGWEEDIEEYEGRGNELKMMREGFWRGWEEDIEEDEGRGDEIEEDERRILKRHERRILKRAGGGYWISTNLYWT